MKKVLQTSYKDLNIKVVNTWFFGVTLFVDGEGVAHNNKIIHEDRDDPIFTYELQTKDGLETLKVYIEALVRVKILMQVNGETIARID